MEKSSVPFFACKVKQGENVIYLPIPYGALENLCRALLSHNEGTELIVCGLGMMDL